MAENLDLRLTAEAWTEIVIREWEKKVESLMIGVSMQLVDSFTQHVYTQADGDPSKIRFAFEWYGKMVDYGVGKGVTLLDRDSMIAAGLTTRRPKPWYTDVFYKQLEVLRHLFEEKTAKRIERFIVRNLEDNADFGYNDIRI